MISANICHGGNPADSHIPTGKGLPAYYPEDGGISEI